jgi:hypothetical protein
LVAPECAVGGQILQELRGCLWLDRARSRRGGAATGQADAIAILMRRTLMRTSAPIFKYLETNGAAGGLSKTVSRSPLPSSSGTRAMLMAIRLASSLVSTFA